MLDCTSLIMIGKKAAAMEARIAVTIRTEGLHVLASMDVRRLDRLSDYEVFVTYQQIEARSWQVVTEAIEHANRMAKDAARG